MVVGGAQPWQLVAHLAGQRSRLRSFCLRELLLVPPAELCQPMHVCLLDALQPQAVCLRRTLAFNECGCPAWSVRPAARLHDCLQVCAACCCSARGHRLGGLQRSYLLLLGGHQGLQLLGGGGPAAVVTEVAVGGGRRRQQS